MPKRPSGNMDAMAIPKAEARSAVPFAPSAEPKTGQSPYKPTSLTIRLDGEQYAALRGYCQEEEGRTGRRVSHQEVMVRGLMALIEAAR